MKQIQQYHLNIYQHEQNIYIPQGSTILSVSRVDRAIFLTAIIDDNNYTTEIYTIRTYSAGSILPNDMEKYKFLGTVIIDGSGQHVFISINN